MKHSDFHYLEHYPEIKKELNAFHCIGLFLFKEKFHTRELWKNH